MDARVSVIMPVDRSGSEPLRAIAAVLAQRTEAAFELILVGVVPTEVPGDSRIVLVPEEDRNPALRRNRAVAIARGSVLAFVDDDAFAAPDWIESAVHYFDEHPDVVAIGGPDPPPPDALIGERISDVLLSTRWIGSGVLCHERPAGIRAVRAPHDIALVNLFVRREAFEHAGGFEESIGYVGEDTDLVGRLVGHGRVVYHSGVVVRHRRRAFPSAYLRQRWRYRVKTGRLMARGHAAYARNPKILGFLAAGAAFLVIATLHPPTAIALLALYAGGILILAARPSRLPVVWWWVIPFAFVIHHATYFTGIVTGVLMEAAEGIRKSR